MSRYTKKMFSCTCVLVLAVFTILHGAAAADRFEQPGVFSAGNMMTQQMLQGENYKIEEQVPHDGFFYQFTVHSDFGDFQAVSIPSLVMLLKEIEAIAAMNKVETSDTAIDSLQESGKKTVEGVKNLFSDPEGSIRGAGQGISSLFNRAKVTLGSRELTEGEDSRMEQLIGLTKSKGEIANKYGVSIYSKNKVLQEELDRLATADYLGGISVGLATSAVSGVGGLVLSTSGATRLLNETINATSPAELWMQNEKKLTAMTGEPDTVELFLNNPVFTPAQQTIMGVSLEKMEKVPNRDLFIKVGLQASNQEMAKLITNVSVMAAAYHSHVAPLAGFSPMARLLRGKKKDGTIVVLLPADHMIWTEQVASVADAIMKEGKSAKAPGFEIWTLGSFSDMAKAALASEGWQVHDNAHAVLFKEASMPWPVKQQ